MPKNLGLPENTTTDSVFRQIQFENNYAYTQEKTEI